MSNPTLPTLFGNVTMKNEERKFSFYVITVFFYHNSYLVFRPTVTMMWAEVLRISLQFVLHFFCSPLAEYDAGKVLHIFLHNFCHPSVVVPLLYTTFFPLHMSMMWKVRGVSDVLRGKDGRAPRWSAN